MKAEFVHGEPGHGVALGDGLVVENLRDGFCPMP